MLKITAKNNEKRWFMLKNESIILDLIKGIAPEAEVIEYRNQTTVKVLMKNIIEVLTMLKNNAECKFDMLLDVTSIDRTQERQCYEVVYNLYSMMNGNRLRLKIDVPAVNPECPTATGIWESANWYERETYDMMGIKFIGHPDLRRFYMPEDYCYPDTGKPIYPLRKTVPLAGIPNSLPLPPYPEKYGEIKK